MAVTQSGPIFRSNLIQTVKQEQKAVVFQPEATESLRNLILSGLNSLISQSRIEWRFIVQVERLNTTGMGCMGSFSARAMSSRPNSSSVKVLPEPGSPTISRACPASSKISTNFLVLRQKMAVLVRKFHLLPRGVPPSLARFLPKLNQGFIMD